MNKMFVEVILSNMMSWRFQSFLNILSYASFYGKKTNFRKEQIDQMKKEQTISLYKSPSLTVPFRYFC